MTDKQCIAWHNRRYSKDQIKAIQVALNKTAQGKPIKVDGIMGGETFNAIKKYQSLHQDILKLDGLAGDQTLSSLGVSGIGDASLPSTRKGQVLSKQQIKGITGVSDLENERMRLYYNSKEMLDYLFNITNIKSDPINYTNHYYNALNYVSPEIASRLRYINDEGDEYDEEVVRNRNESVRREIGIKEFKKAMANGVIKSAKDYDKWMKDHNLSSAEMQELINDPEFTRAMYTAGVRADNGRVNSQLARAWRFEDGVRDYSNQFAVNNVYPAAMGAVALGTGTLPAFMGSLAGAKATDAIINAVSDGTYNNWNALATDKLNLSPDYEWLAGFTNPGAIIGGGILGGFNTARSFRLPKRLSIQRPNPRYRPDLTYFVKPSAGKEILLNESELMYLHEPMFLQINGRAGYDRHYPRVVTLKPRNPEYGVVDYTYNMYPSFLYNSTNTEPISEEVPSYDDGVTYGSYIGQYRYQYKTGGKLNYLNY